MTVKTLEHDAFETLALVASINTATDMTRPERHSVRTLKATAESILREAFRNAQAIVFEAKDLARLVDETRSEAQQPNKSYATR